MDKLQKIILKPATCGLDMGDGSERAEYVNQDYILWTLGRPHRFVSIMYTYYPKDEQWPARISEACKDMEISFQWDYPYDDYFPYHGGKDGNTKGQPFEQMRDIRRHGQDVALTLTVDCSLEDEYLRAIAKDLKPFGRMRLRINHECDGNWFTHNQRFSYAEIGEFFVRFAKIIKEEAPQIQVVFCGVSMDGDTGHLKYEQEFTEAIKAADVCSMDCYLTLHYGWPYDICEKDCNSYSKNPIKPFVNNLKSISKRMEEICGEKKPLAVCEFNVDGDVTGPKTQGEPLLRFVEEMKKDDLSWFNGFALYQFRDRGRLGLEIEDPNNKAVGIPQPMIEDYKKLLKDETFLPKQEEAGEVTLPATLRWGGAEDAEGVQIPITFEKHPVFCEVYFEEELNLMMEINGHWFYKAPGTKCVDLMPAFFGDKIADGASLPLKIFAPPASGENDPSQGDDWDINYYTTMTKMPTLRIRYESVWDVE